MFDMPGTDLVFDILYLKDRHGQLLPKEVAVGSVDKPRRRMLWVVAPPYHVDVLPPRIRGINNCLTKYVHGIHWYTDGITLADLYQELYEVAEGVGEQSRLYAIGEQPVQILEQATGHKIINLSGYEDCPSLHDPPPKTAEVCSWHSCLQAESRGSQCALQNVKRLQCYLNPFAFEDLINS